MKCQVCYFLSNMTLPDWVSIQSLASVRRQISHACLSIGGNLTFRKIRISKCYKNTNIMSGLSNKMTELRDYYIV